MRGQTIALPETDTTVTAVLPPVPQPETCASGHDWIEQLASPWWPVIGFMGALIGDWPYQCVAMYTDRASDEYGIAVWDEGAVTVYGYAVEEQRQNALKAYMTEG
ncbi:hypothetical protein ACIA7S_28740 [Streptomyces sp. NPDC051643]|uniref:hypothetical protein n=1 Tax=Streptomyces sp. NPDC051643 TaxID=3365665 RepID=UPI0037B0D4EF